MSPEITIDNEVWELLKANAEPFVDEPNDVLRRMLGIGSNGQPSTVTFVQQTRMKIPSGKRIAGKPGRRARGTGVTEKAMRFPLIEVLYEAGGEARTREVLAEMGKKIEHLLSDTDTAKDPRGQVRWQNTARWARQHLLDDGLLEKSRRGYWKLSDLGIAEYERQLEAAG